MRNKTSRLTPKLRQNWWIDAVLAFSAITAVLSSFYFLAFPVNGFQGGRNPYYNFVLIFDRHGWDFLHTWSGVAMILAALIHIFIHWDWIIKTAGRTWSVVTGRRKAFGSRLTYNIILDAFLALCFLLCSISGVYFLLFPHGGTRLQTYLFSAITWDLIHTWSGVLMVISAILHFVLHWKWITNITTKVIKPGHPVPVNPDKKSGLVSVK